MVRVPECQATAATDRLQSPLGLVPHLVRNREHQVVALLEHRVTIRHQHACPPADHAHRCVRGQPQVDDVDPGEP